MDKNIKNISENVSILNGMIIIYLKDGGESQEDWCMLENLPKGAGECK